MNDYPAGACNPEPSSGLEAAMSRLDAEVGEIELAASSLIDRLHSALMPSTQPPGQPDGIAVKEPVSPVTNHINGYAAKLFVISRSLREATQRLDL